MRRILVATVLLASSAATASFASTTATEANTPTQVTRISTGVIAPQLLNSATIQIPSNAYDSVLPKQFAVGVNLNVDEQGNARNVQIAKSFNADVDARVAAAVQKFHFRPATLDKQNIPVDLKLTVVVQR